MHPLDPSTVPSYYRNYVLRVNDLQLIEALKNSNQKLLQTLQTIPEQNGEHRYQAGKWSIKELLCHSMDVERIFCYRALRFSRADKTELHGFDDDQYVLQANAHARTLQQLATEIERLRATTLDLFLSFTPEMMQRTGIASNAEMSVLMLGYIIAGHETHHHIILKEQYLNA